MTGSIDATSSRYDAEDSPDSPEAVLVKRASNTRLALIQLPPSPANSDVIMRQASPRGSPSATTREERRITRNIDRGAPGDRAIFSEGKTPEQKELAKKKSQYYGDIFAHREPNNSARERVARESPILADVRTSIIIQDEYTFTTDLSYTLSTRYQRPENSIIVTVTHSCCLLFGGSFDPAYTLTINALPSQLQPVTNKRNAALLSKAMEEGLGVGPERGLIKFCAIAEENIATDGKTIAQEIEELEKETAETNVNLQRSLSKSSMKYKRRPSLPTKSQLPTHEESSSSIPDLSDHDTPPIPAIPTQLSNMDKRAQKAQKMGRRKSFIATMFGRAG